MLVRIASINLVGANLPPEVTQVGGYDATVTATMARNNGSRDDSRTGLDATLALYLILSNARTFQSPRSSEQYIYQHWSSVRLSRQLQQEREGLRTNNHAHRSVSITGVATTSAD